MPSHSNAPYISEQLRAPVLEELNAMKASRTGSRFASIRRRTAVMVALYCRRWNSSGTRNTLDTGMRSTGTCRCRHRGGGGGGGGCRDEKGSFCGQGLAKDNERGFRGGGVTT